MFFLARDCRLLYGRVMDEPATATAPVKKRRGPLQPGQTANPFGAPRKGASYREMLSALGKMDRAEVEQFLGLLPDHPEHKRLKSKLVSQLAALPKGVPLKALTAIAAVLETIEAPNASLLNFIADREEGKIGADEPGRGVQVCVVFHKTAG
jgi:hypothetical protein